MSEKCIQACRIAAKCQNEILIIPENSGTRLVTPTQFERYCQPIISEFADISHKNRKMLFMHACGHLKYLLPYIAKTKIDGIESLTSPPTGDTTITDVWDIFDGKCVIWGGLDPVSFANNSPAKLVDEVTKTWETVKNNPRFILMPSDSTPANVPMENFEIIRKTVEAFRY
jgi:uroporphyrinogen-III decarboxylase